MESSYERKRFIVAKEDVQEFLDKLKEEEECLIRMGSLCLQESHVKDLCQLVSLIKLDDRQVSTESIIKNICTPSTTYEEDMHQLLFMMDVIWFRDNGTFLIRKNTGKEPIWEWIFNTPDHPFERFLVHKYGQEVYEFYRISWPTKHE